MDYATLTKQLPRLEQLAVVGAAGSLGLAAKRLKVSTSSLSESMRRLESIIGGAVLVRTSRGVRMTELGRMLVDHAATMRSSFSTLEKRLAEYDIDRSRIRLWTKEPLAATLWPHYWQAMKDNGVLGSRRLAIELRISRSNATIEDALRADPQAMALVASPDSTAEISHYEVYRDRWKLFGGVTKNANAPQRLFWFRSAVAGPGRNLGDWLATVPEGVELIDVDSLLVATELALAGEGFALLPTEFVRLSRAHAVLRSVTLGAVPGDVRVEFPDLPEFQVCLAASPGSLSSIARALLRTFRAVHAGAEGTLPYTGKDRANIVSPGLEAASTRPP